MARSGYDWVCLDSQHGAFTPDSVVSAAVGLCGAVDIPVFVRAAGSGAAEIGRLLDVGVAGVIVPTVESADQAREIVRAVRYPPSGNRSWGPLDALLGRPASAPPQCHVMVETRAGLDDLDAIARVEGLAGVFVGPFDLSSSLGLPIDDLIAATGRGDPLPRVVAACDAGGVTPGIFAGEAGRAAALQKIGFRMVATGLDAVLLRDGAVANAEA